MRQRERFRFKARYAVLLLFALDDGDIAAAEDILDAVRIVVEAGRAAHALPGTLALVVNAPGGCAELAAPERRRGGDTHHGAIVLLACARRAAVRGIKHDYCRPQAFRQVTRLCR